VAAAGLHGRVDLVGLAVADQVPDGRGGHHDLDPDDPPVAVGGGDELLADHALEGAGQLDPDLLLLVGREHVDHAVDGLGRVLGVEGGEDQVAGLGRGQGDRDRLQIPQLADQDDVGVLAQDVLEGVGERLGVLADLALVDQAVLVGVEELDRVLDGHDVVVALPVGQVDQAGQGGRLARAGGPGDQHEPPGQVGKAAHLGGDAEGLQGLDLLGDEPEGGPDRVALEVDVEPEPGLAGQGVGAVQLLLVLQPLALALGEDRVDHRLGLGRLQLRVVLQLAEAAVDPHGRLGPGGQVQVGGAKGQHLLQQLGDPDPALGSPVPQSHPGRVGSSHQSLGLHAPLPRSIGSSGPFGQIGAAGGRLERLLGQVPRRQPRR
jgi:hypothetical protein